MKYSEQAITFACEQEALTGMLATPQSTGATTGVLVIVGGPQYRAGSHRQFVLLARALASAGYPVLRFDYRGMGDSTGEQRDFLQVTSDVSAAIDALQRQVPSVKRVALWGLCDGAAAALLYVHDTSDTRIGGLCMLNPWVRSEAILARTHVKHYYAHRLQQKDFWLKLLRGQVAGAALSGLWRNVRLAAGTARTESRPQAFQDRMASAWSRFDGGILLVLSGDDYTAREFQEYVAGNSTWAGLLGKPNVTRRVLAQADHTFSDAGQREQVEAITCAWLDGCESP